MYLHRDPCYPHHHHHLYPYNGCCWSEILNFSPLAIPWRKKVEGFLFSMFKTSWRELSPRHLETERCTYSNTESSKCRSYYSLEIENSLSNLRTKFFVIKNMNSPSLIPGHSHSHRIYQPWVCASSRWTSYVPPGTRRVIAPREDGISSSPVEVYENFYQDSLYALIRQV